VSSHPGFSKATTVNSIKIEKIQDSISILYDIPSKFLDIEHLAPLASFNRPIDTRNGVRQVEEGGS
jgi:hypothetical protein